MSWREWGDIEGDVDRVHGSVLFVREVLTDDVVRCRFSEPVSVEVGRRVRVTGIRCLDKMDAHEIEVIPEDHELPTIDDIKGMDITGGLSSEEYVRQLRDGD